jgi:hypothetical protein
MEKTKQNHLTNTDGKAKIVQSPFCRHDTI